MKNISRIYCNARGVLKIAIKSIYPAAEVGYTTLVKM